MFDKIVLLVAGIVAAQAVDYCDPALCDGTTSHIGCHNKGAWGRQCPDNARLVDMSRLKDLIVKGHNERRNQLAGGGMKHFRPAARMATMQWNEELASLAALNVKKCFMQHDECHNVPSFSYAGQNLASFGYTGAESGFSDEYIINSALSDWWDESKDARKRHMAKYPSRHNGATIGHFTVMAADKNVAVGCAAARYFDGKFHNMLTACNYATTNIVDEPIYDAGSTGSACTTGRNPAYPNLCTVAEKYDLH